MARLIDANAFCKELIEERDYPSRTQEFMDAIEVAIADLCDMPTADSVEVVRCKDCKNWGGVTFGNVCRRWSAPLAGMKNCTKEDDFCSYGERREGE